MFKESELSLVSVPGNILPNSRDLIRFFRATPRAPRTVPYTTQWLNSACFPPKPLHPFPAHWTCSIHSRHSLFVHKPFLPHSPHTHARTCDGTASKNSRFVTQLQPNQMAAIFTSSVAPSSRRSSLQSLSGSMVLLGLIVSRSGMLLMSAAVSCAAICVGLSRGCEVPGEPGDPLPPLSPPMAGIPKKGLRVAVSTLTTLQHSSETCTSPCAGLLTPLLPPLSLSVARGDSLPLTGRPPIRRRGEGLLAPLPVMSSARWGARCNRYLLPAPSRWCRCHCRCQDEYKVLCNSGGKRQRGTGRTPGLAQGRECAARAQL